VKGYGARAFWEYFFITLGGAETLGNEKYSQNV
jgi:hypothetical protein